jgi:murein DD-endopeptidase MepM/ murein hydrolase activator NlpD
MSRYVLLIAILLSLIRPAAAGQNKEIDDPRVQHAASTHDKVAVTSLTEQQISVIQEGNILIPYSNSIKNNGLLLSEKQNITDYKDIIRQTTINLLERFNNKENAWKVVDTFTDGEWGLSVIALFDVHTQKEVPSEFKFALARKVNGEWKVALPFDFDTEGAATYNDWLAQIPESLISRENKPALFKQPTSIQAQGFSAVSGYKLPWRGGLIAYLTSNAAYHGYPALDFDIQGGNIRGDVVAAKDGIVKFRKDRSNTNCYWDGRSWSCSWQYANIVVIEHSPTEFSWYMHLAPGSIPSDIQEGRFVKQGTKIGVEGNTGWSTGVHLHFHVARSYRCCVGSGDTIAPEWPSSFWEVNFEEIGWSAIQNVGPTTPIASQNDGSSPPPLCPQSGGVILYQHAGYNCGGEGEGAGYVVRSAPGFQNVPGSFNDRASSVIVPSGWSVMLYEHSNAGGGKRCIDAPGDNDFSNDTFDNGVRLNDAVSSFEVFSAPGCRTSQSNRPPNTPSPVSPGDWHVARDGRAPTLCWNNPGDPDGDSVTFFAEVFESAVNAQSGWIGDTCWRPAALDGRAFGYQWRVKARDSRGAESGWSAVWHFTIENPPPPPNNNWQAQYWDNRELRGSPRVSISEGGIYLVRHWGWGGGPHGLPGDEWSARFVKTLYFPGGHYRFHCQHDDGCRLYIDGQLRIDHWWDSSFGGADWGGHLSAGNHEIKVEYYEKTGEAALEVWWQGPGFLPRDESCDYNNGWCAEYYLNRDVRGTAAIRRSEGQSLALDWGNGSPGPTFPADNFSSRFMRRAHFTCGTYRFHFFTDDGIRFWVNDALRLDQWRDQVASYHVDLNLNTGHHTLRVEHYENGGGAAIRAWWEKLADCQPTVAIDHASTHYARPGASVDPTVRVRVTAGYLDGGRGDALAFVGGASLGAAANQPLYGFVQEGGAYTFNVANSDGFRMTAPASEGSYESRWQVRAAGSLVGPVATVRVVVDDTPPAVVIQSPGDSAYINSNTVVLQAAPQDANGVDHVQFFAGYDDGSGWAWRNLGWDTNGADGWQITWNVSTVPDQVGVALFAYAWDLAGNGAGAARWDITLDRTPPSAAIQSLPANQDSTAFIVWWNSGPDISDISRYDLQVQEDGGPWQDWLQNVGPQYVGAWFVGELGRRYAFRIRATDRAGNVSAYSPPVETVIRTCAPDAYEPDNELSAARALPPGQPQMRTFCGAGDHDWVIFQVRPGQRFAIYTTDLGWTTDTVLTLFDAEGNVLAESDDVNYPEDLSSRIEITWTAAYTGTFYARVRHFNRRVAGDGVTYRLVFSPLHRLHLPMVQR